MAQTNWRFPEDAAALELLERIGRGDKKIKAAGLRGSSKALLLSLIAEATGRPLLIVSPAAEQAKCYCRDISRFSGKAVYCCPPWEILSRDVFLTQKDIEAGRIGPLLHLLRAEAGTAVLPLETLVQKIVPPASVRAYIRRISIGDTIDRDELARVLDLGGYARRSLVEEAGEYAVRGNVVDVFTPGGGPFRLVLMGDELESIREFDPVSQRSLNEFVDFDLAPARELILNEEMRKTALKNLRNRMNDLGIPRVLRERLTAMIENGGPGFHPQFIPLFFNGQEHLGSVLDYVSPETLVVIDDPVAVARSESGLISEADRFLERARREGRFCLEREAYYHSCQGLLADGRFQTISLISLEIGETAGEDDTISFQTRANRDLRQEVSKVTREDSLMAPVVENVRLHTDAGGLVVFYCANEDSLHRISHILQGYNLPLKINSETLADDLARHARRDGGMLVLKEGRISEGFAMPGLGVSVLSEEEIFGRKVPRRKPRTPREGFFLKSFGELKEGDFIVHVDHGIGIYKGLKKLSLGDVENDFLLLEYKEEDKLYIPVDRLDQIQRYIGPESQNPELDKLGSGSWENAKRKVRRSVEEIAEELVALYAAREVQQREAFSPTDRYYEEFSEAFEFEETPDQARAIEDINEDLADSKPMDRLICGDAGFGKTEVAIRAAFRVAMDGKQVAVLVPTTILAEQHYLSFANRLEKYPLRVVALNRFRTRQEQREITEKLAAGAIDIVIGTHRVLQKDVAFKNLGLVIIDEEQRFGVTHKERLKKLRTMVDVLTLTATPIPRTLELSLVGIRDLSVINTAPEDRSEIRTHVLEFDSDVIREAILTELRRGGQVYFVHDRVKSIYPMQRFLQKLVPEASIGVAHGQMKPRELEQIMVKFVQREYNVLLCTTIIASGIDIPSANTIIMNRADRFGLSQLYQLRGRVGRSKEKSCAYLLIPGGAVLSRDAQKRLEVIKEFTEPGSGFKIATHDLEIRGAGNLLGSSQSGHIAAVGYEMYLDLIEKTIRELRGEAPAKEEVRPEIQLGIPAFIPEDYLPDMNSRLMLYKRISMAAGHDELDALRDELSDLYGYIPQQVENLLQVIDIRNTLRAISGKRMDYNGSNFQIAFRNETPVSPEKIVRLTRRRDKKVKFSPDMKLSVTMPGLSGGEIINSARELLLELGA
jgi:transcription-repair coupling factor (superfamily II helicase)